MYLEFKDECFYPEDYKDFESFWEVLPKDENGELEKYYPEIDFIKINNFDLDYPNNKEDVEELYKFITTLDTYSLNYSYDIYDIIYGLYLYFNYNLNWKDLGNINDNAFNYIADRFAFECDNYNTINEYLKDYLNLTDYQFDVIIRYFDVELFIEDNFDVNESYYYFKY